MKKKNFCDVCGLKVKFEETEIGDAQKTEDFFKQLGELGLREGKRYSRHVHDIVGTTSENSYCEFCAYGSEKWIKKGRCKDFQIAIPGIMLSEYLSISTANKNSRTANRLIVAGTIIGALLVLIGTGLNIFSQEVKDILICVF